MIRKAFVMSVNAGCEEEYERRHRPIWQELEEVIVMCDRVVVLSGGAASGAIGEFSIDVPRPRDVAVVRCHPRFSALQALFWAVLGEEVL